MGDYVKKSIAVLAMIFSCSASAQTFLGGVTTPLTLNMPPNSLINAFNTFQSGAGTTTTNCSAIPDAFQTPCLNFFAITADNINASSPSHALDGWQFNHQFGGSSVQGARQSLNVISTLTAATSSSNANRAYVAGVFAFNADSGDGGTALTGVDAKGSVYALNPMVRTVPGATNLRAVVGGEVDINHTGTALYRIGWTVVSVPTNQGAQAMPSGRLYDLAYSIGANGLSWAVGLAFTNLHGSAPISTTGCMICTDGTTNTVDTGIDFGNYVFTTNIIKSANFLVDGTGGISGVKISLTASPGNAWNIDASTAVSIANGASQALQSGSGFLFVHDQNDGATAIYLCSAGLCTLGTSVGSIWVASTTAPAAGKMSVAHNGSVYAIYNNAGGARFVSLGAIRTRSVP